MADLTSLLREGVVARIARSTDGGPLRRIINGRAFKPTGAFVSIKAGGRAMPWESIRCELPVISIAELGSPVLHLLSQPHRLELFVRGRRRPLIYFPDLELTVDRGLFDALARKVPFAKAVMEWHPGSSPSRGTRKVVLEVKDDDDRRNDDKDYRDKLRLAASIYRRLGAGFFTVVRSSDLEFADASFIDDVLTDRYTAVGSADIDAAVQCVLDSGGVTATYADLVAALGSGPVGRAKAVALHVRRVLSINMTAGLLPDAAVWLIEGAGRLSPKSSSPGLPRQ